MTTQLEGPFFEWRLFAKKERTSYIIPPQGNYGLNKKVKPPRAQRIEMQTWSENGLIQFPEAANRFDGILGIKHNENVAKKD